MHWDKIVVETEKVIDPNPKIWIDAAVENCYNWRYQEALEQIQQTRKLKDCDNLIRLVCDIVETYLYAQMGDYGHYYNNLVVLKSPKNIKTMENLEQSVYAPNRCYFREYARYLYEFGQKIKYLSEDTEFESRMKHFFGNYFMNWCVRKLYESRRVLGGNIETVGDSELDDLNEIINREMPVFLQKLNSNNPFDLTIKKVTSSEFRFIKEMVALLSLSGAEYTVAFVEVIPEP